MEETATLKRFFLEGDQVRLQPENSQMAPIIVPAGNVQVHGRVVGVIRRMN
jgi:repressor LexA